MESVEDLAPILAHKARNEPSVFTPANLLREARRQKSISHGEVPEVCVLDPDGDLSRHLKKTGARRNPSEEAIAFARSENLLAVEMEAAALYALAEAKDFPVICIARVTNQMGLTENDFEKGDELGNASFRRLIAELVEAWTAHE